MSKVSVEQARPRSRIRQKALIAIAVILLVLHFGKSLLPFLEKLVPILDRPLRALRDYSSKHELDQLAAALKSQTSELPQIDYVEVYCLDNDIGVSPDLGFFPVSLGANQVVQTPIFGKAELIGQEAEDFAQIWRTRQFDMYCFLAHEPFYGLRFYRDGQLVFETSLCWRNCNFSMVNGDSKRQQWGFYDVDEKLLTRLQELVPLPSAAKTLVAMAHGRAHWRAEQFELALVEFSKAIALSDEPSTAYLWRGLTNQKFQRAEDALSDIDRAVQLAPGNVSHRIERGRMLAALGHFDEAIVDLSWGTTIPNLNARSQIEIRYDLVGVLCDSGGYEQALTHLDELIDHPALGNFYNPVDIYHLRARIHERLSDFDAAERDREKAAQQQLLMAPGEVWQPAKDMR